MDKYLKEYEEKFGEQFPIMLCRGCDDEEIIEIIDECISKNEPYVVEHGDY
jgi:hypothetical protein